MSQRGVLFGLVALLVTVSFAGCLGDDDKAVDPSTDDGDVTTGDGDAKSGTSGGTTGGTGGGAKGDDADLAAGAPTAAFEIVLDGNATAGLPIDFDASASTDPDGDNLTYKWDFGDNGTAEGVLVNYTYEAAGNFTVTLTVTDTGGLASTANETLAVSGPAALEPAMFFSEDKTITLANPLIAAIGTQGTTTTLADYKTRGGSEGVTWQTHTVTGFPAEVESLRFKATFTSTDNTVTNLVLKVFPEDGSAQVKGSSFPSGKPDVTLTAEEEGITETTYIVFVYMSVGASQGYTLEASYA